MSSDNPKAVKTKMQLIVAVMMIALWGIGLLIAQIDGSEMLKVTTPFMTMTVGWLFTDKATS